MNAKRAAEGLVLIGIGVVLLANTVGGLPWTVWLSIFSLWPVALIGAGIDVIGKSTDQVWLRVVSSLLVLAAILYGAFVMAPGSWGLPVVFRATAGQGDLSRTEPHDERVERGRASVNAGATELVIEGGRDLADLRGSVPAGMAPTLTAQRSGSAADVRLDYGRSSTVWVPGSNESRVTFSLDRDVRWEMLDVNAGAAKLTVDLRDLRADALSASFGAADTTVIFAEGRDCTADLRCGAANVTVRVPKGADVRVASTGLLLTSVPAGFEMSGDWGHRAWRRDGGGSGVIDISVEGGIANLDVQTY